jgi:hypothetical protein
VEILRVKVIVSVKVIPYMLGSPELKLKHSYILGEGGFRIRVEWFPELGKLSESKSYSLHWVF